MNNAGLLGTQVETSEFPEDDWRNVIDANLMRLFLVSKDFTSQHFEAQEFTRG